MKAKIVFVLLLTVLAAGVSAQTRIEVGSRVLAYWEDAEMYFVGTTVEYNGAIKGGGYLVVFEDGDQAVVPIALIRPFTLKNGSPVYAMWSDGLFYPGTIASIVGDAVFIEFDDGDSGWTSWAGIAVE